MKTVNHFLNHLLSAVYPNKCICCGEIIDDNIEICYKCDNSIERNNLTNVCLDCGLDNDDCVCKYNIYRFNKIVCVFKNEGLAQNAYYSYKFAKKQHLVNFFANEMFNAVKFCFDDVVFNYVCSVPSFKKFTYDHSGYLAKNISEKMNIPYLDDALGCVVKVKKQHKASIAERINNVEGKYRCNYRIDGANILLVDDIKTTGATLDECARTLLFAGAKSVYCVTALGTSTKK